MSAFTYRNGVLHAENVAVTEIAAAVGTPFYCYSTAALAANYAAFERALGGLGVGIAYALKANSNQAVIRALARLGAGADVVSEGELRRALAAGVPPDRIVFSGVGKTAEEMAAALRVGIHQINVESLPELERLNQIALSLGRVAPVALRINPDVDANTHAKITTGRRDNKFGVAFDSAGQAFRRASELPGIDPVGVAVHIGSQLTDLAPYRAAYRRLAELVQGLRGDGIDIVRVDLGGGMGIPYREGAPFDLGGYAGILREIVAPLGCAMMIEPGRSLVGNAGVLVARVVFVKEGDHRRFLIVDAAMNDLIRPALYEAWHDIRPVLEPAADAMPTAYDVVGPVCETGDTFARDRALPRLSDGDLVVFTDAGAYGAVMASTYNSRPLIPEVMVDDARFAIVRKRPTFEEMIAGETVPAWLNEPPRR